MRKLVAFVAGAMCGGIVGAVAALLLAPVPGSELRQSARVRFDEMLAEGRQAAADRRAELEAQLAALKRPAAAP
jgi:gas vesicle protein